MCPYLQSKLASMAKIMGPQDKLAADIHTILAELLEVFLAASSQDRACRRAMEVVVALAAIHSRRCCCSLRLLQRDFVLSPEPE